MQRGVRSLVSACVAGALIASLGAIPAYATEGVVDPPIEVEAPEPEPVPEPPTVAAPVKVPTPLTLPLKEGQRGARIGVLHERLVWLGGNISDESLRLDRFGKSTTAAVRAMQQKYGLRATGVVDEVTWTTLRKYAEKPGTLPQRCRNGLVLCIDKTAKVVRLVRDGAVRTTLDARFGKAGYDTREGTFRVTRKSRDHVSNTYHVWMPFALFFAGGQAVHYSPTFRRIGHVSGSHGCVNLRDIDDARTLFDQVPVGSTVVVYRSGK